MNFLGHAYVAYKTTGRLNQYLLAGSYLPDLVPFVPHSVFGFEEMHEGGEKLLKFLKKNSFYAQDLAIGMISHSSKLGADKFNREIENWLLEEKTKRKLALKIVGCSEVSFEVAFQWRVHNYLWAGIEIYLLRKNFQFVQKIADLYPEINNKKISLILSNCFQKEPKAVQRMVDYHFGAIDPIGLLSLNGLVKIWRKGMAGLPEKDNIDEIKTRQLFEEIYTSFENQWQGILEKVIDQTKINLENFLKGFN